jgi:nicotinamidase-related amidase
MPDLHLAPKTTALVLIDLQRGILARDVKPHAAADVLSRAIQLAERCRQVGALVVLVRVTPSADGRDRLAPPADQTFAPPSPLPEGYADFPPALGPKAGDIVITKRQWGAFYGTELDLQLRRRGIRTLILGGIATTFGVESTARAAYERGYAQVFAEDAMAALTAEAHAFALANVLGRIGQVRSTSEILAGVSA